MSVTVFLGMSNRCANFHFRESNIKLNWRQKRWKWRI